MIRNKLATQTELQKKAQFNRDVKTGVVAYKSDKTTVPLSKCLPAQVEFIAGLWRVQNEFPYKIYNIRDKEMVLLKQLPHYDHVLFDYFAASLVSYNCYGPFISKNPDFIVAKYATDDGIYWGYGTTLEKARAFLGIRLYDEYMDLIHRHACKKQLSRQKK